MRALVIAALLAGCVDISDVHNCTSDADCVLDGKHGHCEDSRFCSFPDATCGNLGARYQEHAGELSNVCSIPAIAASELGAVELADADDSIQSTCAPAGARDLYFEITSPVQQVLFIDTGGAQTNTAGVLALRSGSCPGTSELACVSKGCGDLQYSQMVITVEPGKYCLVVEQSDPAATSSLVALRFGPSGRRGEPLAPPSPLASTTCMQPDNRGAFLFGVCPTGIHFTTTVDPDDADGLDVALSLRALVPDGPTVVGGLNNASGTMAESIDVRLTNPGLYWLLVDRVGGPACGRITVGFNYTP